MAGRLRVMFDELRGKRPALITYATGYYPDRGASSGVIRAMLECGADAVEIGLPFSDPVLDGKVIQESSKVALEAGANTPGILELAEELRTGTEKPIMLMSYYNPVLKYGLERFAKETVEVGIDAVIIPDLPIEEMSPWKIECDSAGLDTVAFCSVTTDRARIKRAGEMSSGFLYCASLLGTTGPRDEISLELPTFIRRVRRNASCPIAVGLGISTPEQCKKVGSLSDGIIVGSALVQTITGNGRDLFALRRMVKEMAASLS